MAHKDIKKKRGRGVKKTEALPFTSKNYQLFGIGLLILIVGYIALSRGPWNSFWSLTLAPILLVLAYCIVFPVAILYRKRQNKQEDEKK